MDEEVAAYLMQYLSSSLSLQPVVRTRTQHFHMPVPATKTTREALDVRWGGYSCELHVTSLSRWFGVSITGKLSITLKAITQTSFLIVGSIVVLHTMNQLYRQGLPAKYPFQYSTAVLGREKKKQGVYRPPTHSIATGLTPRLLVAFKLSASICDLIDVDWLLRESQHRLPPQNSIRALFTVLTSRTVYRKPSHPWNKANPLWRLPYMTYIWRWL